MRQLLLLLLIPFVALAGPKEEIEAEKVRMKTLLHRLYLSEQVERHCRKNPEDFYPVKYADRHIEIDCRTRNAWVALVRRDG